MKICLFLQRRFAYIGHDLAFWLKKKYNITEFCGYVQLRWSYDWLKEQKDVIYSSLLLDEDIHKKYQDEKLDSDYLAYLEKEYGIPNLWPYIAVDRIIMSNQLVREYPYDKSLFSHEEMMRMLQVRAKAIIEFLEQEKPDVLMFSAIGSMGSCLLYEIAKKKKIRILTILPAYIRDRFLLSEDYNRFTYVEQKLRTHSTSSASVELAKKVLCQFREQPQSYYPDIDNMTQKTNRQKQLKFLSPKNFLQSLRWFGELIIHYIHDKKYNDYSSDMNPWYYLIDRIKRKSRNLIGLSDLYDTFNPEEDFAFFPLHLEPELALLFQAPFYTDQKSLIRQIAKSLPVHYKLYVKEHPLMVDFRPRSFYKELKKIPNVKLINPTISGVKVIPHAKLVTTITGTAGWEAALLKKPVITFGDHFYNSLSMIKKCTEIEKLPYLIKDCLENFTNNYDEKELLHFIAAILEESTQVNLDYLWEKEVNKDKKRIEIEPLADLIGKKLLVS